MTLATDAVEYARVIAQLPIGYSQANRLTFKRTLANHDLAGDIDCSALASGVYNIAGITPPFPDSTWTGSIRQLATERGFTALTWSQSYHPAAGDLVLSEEASGGLGHVAIITGTDNLVEATADENGELNGGTPGDQTGREVWETSYSGHYMTRTRRWTHILVPPRVTATPTTTPTAANETEDDMLIVSRTGDETGFLLNGLSFKQITYTQAQALMAIGVRQAHANPEQVMAIMEAVHESADDNATTAQAYANARAASRS